jgi:hypothetical protein
LPVLDAVERSDGTILERALDTVEDALEAVESTLDTAPARCDQLDEEREILDAGGALRAEIALQVLKASDRLGRKPAHLGDVAGYREDFVAEGVFDRAADTLRHGRLELGCRGGEGLEGLARALERAVDGSLVVPLAHAGEPPASPF